MMIVTLVLGCRCGATTHAVVELTAGAGHVDIDCIRCGKPRERVAGARVWTAGAQIEAQRQALHAFLEEARAPTCDEGGPALVARAAVP
jgi:hypothetical protein